VVLHRLRPEASKGNVWEVVRAEVLQNKSKRKATVQYLHGSNCTSNEANVVRRQQTRAETQVSSLRSGVRRTTPIHGFVFFFRDIKFLDSHVATGSFHLSRCCQHFSVPWV